MLTKAEVTPPLALRQGLRGYEVGDVWWETRNTVTYRGQRTLDRMPVLIKLLRGLESADTLGNWLERDYQVAQRLRDKCAAKPFALERVNNSPVLIYADEGARPLEALAAKAPLDLETVLAVGARIAQAVSALHEERLFHCNLNPTTIWIKDTSADVLISEFSCARHPDASPLPSGDEPFDIRYISPEQTGRFQKTLDQRTDIYSLGIILFRLVTGKVPFEGRNPLHVIDGHLTRQPTFPAELGGTLPTGVCKMVLKALAKTPEARYFSVTGLAADLLECLSQCHIAGTLETFEPGHHDAKGVLRISDRLYGRERDMSIASEKMWSARRSRPAMLLVNGAPGVGKSAFLGEFEKSVGPKNAWFALGKFDQYKRNVPYLALVQAMQQLISQLLGESKEQIEAWRSRILTAVGDNAQLLIDLIPTLELITGPQPPVRALPPTQARNRFNRAFRNLIQAFASRDQLLCVVMDDLQWVDPASLGLLVHVLTDPDIRNVVFVGAYRDTEMSQAHPLELTTRELTKSGTDIEIVHLGELKEDDVLQLVRDTFGVSKQEACDLAHLLHARTAGNPLYVRQLLHLLYDNNLIAFDYGSGKWTWDLRRIRQEGVTQDVVDLLKIRFEALHQESRDILATAACLGSTFNLEKVAVAAARPLHEVLQSVTIGVEQGLIVPLEYDAVLSRPDPPFASGGMNRFRFLHDRIQQAALDCVADDAKKDFRLQIGRRLMAVLGPGDEGVPQPDVLSNLNYAWQLIAEAGERRRAAYLNLVAGRAARQSLAYQSALDYVSVGLGLLEEKSWRSCYELSFELHSEALECEYLVGHLKRADHLFRVLITNARSNLDKARTYLTKILLDTNEERYEQAVEVGTEALRLFEVRYARAPPKLHLLLELARARMRMRGRNPQDLIQARALPDEKLAALRILVALFPTAYFLSPDLLLFTGLKVVNYSLRYGISPLSACGFVLYGLGLGAALHDYKRGYDFGRFAVELAERGGDPSILCKVLVIFAQFIKLWRDPLDESFPLISRARKLALEVGDHQYVDYAIIGGISLQFSRGCNLQDVLRECEDHKPFVQQSKDAFPTESLTMWQNCALALQGKTAAPHSLSDATYDEEAAELRYHDTHNLTLASYQYTLRLQLAVLFRRYDDALVLSQKGEAVIRSAPGYVTVADHYLFRGLAAAAALTRGAAKSTQHRRTLRHCLTQLRLFAINSPDNFQQYEALLQAEAARWRGQLSKALQNYNRAIELAETHGFKHLVGLANERAAECCLANEQHRLARWYLGSARAAYDEWGAKAKVAWLDREYASLLESEANTSGTAAIHSDIAATHKAAGLVSRRDDSVDVAAALQEANLVTDEGDAERLLAHLMQVVRDQAGAETAHLLVLEGSELRLKATASAASDVVLFPHGSAPITQASFSPAIVNYVIHTGDDLVLGEADADRRFARCRYMADRHPKSVMCSCVRYQGRVLGAIYLEHTQLADAFSEQKLGWLHILATDVGLTVWNGILGRYRDYVHKFAPTPVSKEIDANPESPDLKAKDCDVSILFTDIAGYTRFAEVMEPRQFDEFVNRAFSRFSDEINRYGGTLVEIRGDELFVLFDEEDSARHVWRAAKTALAIARAARRLNEESRDALPPLIMNTGINSGVASVGLHAVEASSGTRLRYGASGTVVNIAARVRGLARNGRILMTADSATRVWNDFAFEDTGEHSLKNVMSRVRIYRLLDEQIDRRL